MEATRWEDAVMTPQEVQDNTYSNEETVKQAEDYYGDTAIVFNPAELACRLQVAKVQAEISFKAGREAEREWSLSNTYRNVPLEESLKKVGRKEVVEFIRKDLPDIHLCLVNGSKYPKKLKEWGL